MTTCHCQIEDQRMAKGPLLFAIHDVGDQDAGGGDEGEQAAYKSDRSDQFIVGHPDRGAVGRRRKGSEVTLTRWRAVMLRGQGTGDSYTRRAVMHRLPPSVSSFRNRAAWQTTIPGNA